MRCYLEMMLAEGRVRVVDREVSGRFELAAVTQASQRESDAPLLFRSVAGSRYRVMTNIFGSRPRLTKMLGGNKSFCKLWTELMARPAIAPQEVAEPNDLEEIHLSDLPAVTYFELDAGPYVTAGVYLANEPDTKVPNLSFHRAQIISDRELRVRLGGPHDLTRYQAKAEARDEPLECVISADRLRRKRA
jgi:UbiD family decarboxylase